MAKLVQGGIMNGLPPPGQRHQPWQKILFS